jgi:hypothetical protein
VELAGAVILIVEHSREKTPHGIAASTRTQVHSPAEGVRRELAAEKLVRQWLVRPCSGGVTLTVTACCTRMAAISCTHPAHAHETRVLCWGCRGERIRGDV